MRELGEFALVGATGTGFSNTADLRVMKFEEASTGPDSELWFDAIDD